MTVKELKQFLSNFPESMDVVDSSYDDIINVKETTWEDTNYPYTKPDKQVYMIE